MTPIELIEILESLPLEDLLPLKEVIDRRFITADGEIIEESRFTRVPLPLGCNRF